MGLSEDREAFEACINGDELALSQALASSANPDAIGPDNDEVTLLMAAAESGSLACVEILLAAGANIHAVNRMGSNAIIFAADTGRLDCIDRLAFAGVDPCLKMNMGWGALGFALQGGHEDCARRLLELGASIHDTHADGGTTSLMAAITPGSVGCVKLALAAGCALEAKDKHDFTAATFAARDGHAEILSLLIERGARIDHECLWSWTLAHLCAHNNQGNCLRALGRAGVDLTAPVRASDDSSHGYTPATLAADADGASALEALAEMGVDLGMADARGWTPFSSAALHGSANALRLLLKLAHGAGAPTHQGRSAVFLAASHGHLECMQLAIEAGCDPSAADPSGATPAWAAAEQGRKECLLALLAHGVDPNARNAKGWTPAMAAAQGGHSECIELLAAAGADLDAFAGQPWERPTRAARIAIESGKPDALAALASAGACLRWEDHEANPAAIAAARHDSDGARCMEILCAHGANIDSLDRLGRSALSIGASEGNPGAVGVLLAAGANPSLADHWGETPLDKALEKTRSARPGEADACCALLLRHGARMSSQPKMAWMAARAAARLDDAEALAGALSNGVDMDALGPSGETLAFVAAERGGASCLKMLIAAGAQMNTPTLHGSSAAMAAAKHGHLGCLEALAAAGANLDWRDEAGDTPAMLAARGGESACVEALIAWGANLGARNSIGQSAASMARGAENEDLAWTIEAALERSDLSRAVTTHPSSTGPRAKRL